MPGLNLELLVPLFALFLPPGYLVPLPAPALLLVLLVYLHMPLLVLVLLVLLFVHFFVLVLVARLPMPVFTFVLSVFLFVAVLVCWPACTYTLLLLLLILLAPIYPYMPCCINLPPWRWPQQPLPPHLCPFHPFSCYQGCGLKKTRLSMPSSPSLAMSPAMLHLLHYISWPPPGPRPTILDPALVPPTP